MGRWCHLPFGSARHLFWLLLDASDFYMSTRKEIDVGRSLIVSVRIRRESRFRRRRFGAELRILPANIALFGRGKLAGKRKGRRPHRIED